MAQIKLVDRIGFQELLGILHNRADAQAPAGIQPANPVTAVSILVFTECSMQRGIFLKKMPPCSI